MGTLVWAKVITLFLNMNVGLHRTFAFVACYSELLNVVSIKPGSYRNHNPRSIPKLISTYIFSIRQLFTQKMTTLGPASSSSSIDTAAVSTLLSNQIEISIEDAIQVHSASNVKFVDGSWWLGQPGRNRHDYAVGPRIAGATFLDIDDVADRTTKSNLPHMMPSPIMFSAVMDHMNIKNDDHIVVYVNDQCLFVHRARYQFGCMGHDWGKVHVLGGSLKDWIVANGPIAEDDGTSFLVSNLILTKSPTYQAVASKSTVNMEQVREMIKTKDENVVLIDARSADRFYARVDEPRPGLIRGHMPTAKNVFFYSLLDPTNPSKLKPLSELKAEFNNAGIDIDTLQRNKNIRFVATCGSGATACTVATALHVCGIDPNQISIYDGSWMEWGDPSNQNEDLITTTDS
jgi:thiosulfate/3-mercaptopyruvate sulfurtransferase